jgi:hypothetical protein
VQEIGFERPVRRSGNSSNSFTQRCNEGSDELDGTIIAQKYTFEPLEESWPPAKGEKLEWTVIEEYFRRWMPRMIYIV